MDAENQCTEEFWRDMDAFMQQLPPLDKEGLEDGEIGTECPPLRLPFGAIDTNVRRVPRAASVNKPPLAPKRSAPLKKRRKEALDLHDVHVGILEEQLRCARREAELLRLEVARLTRSQEELTLLVFGGLPTGPSR